VEGPAVLFPYPRLGAPFKPYFWLEWDTTALDAPFFIIRRKPSDLQFPFPFLAYAVVWVLLRFQLCHRWLWFLEPEGESPAQQD
jgi:hypothetical protein